MQEVLLVSDAVTPHTGDESTTALMALAGALAAGDRRVAVLGAASPDVAARTPGMATRLRKIGVPGEAGVREFPLFEGRAAQGRAALYVVGASGGDRGLVARALATATTALVDDGVLRPDALVAWGDVAAPALTATGAAMRLFVLPGADLAPPLTDAERASLGADGWPAAAGEAHLAALGVTSAHAVVVPSAAAARSLGGNAALGPRASDQPLLPIRFGCDEPPNDPATDPALPAHFTRDSLSGKAECRRSLARRLSLALGPRTLLLGVTGPAGAGDHLHQALAALARRTDVVVAVSESADPATVERARVLSVGRPGSMAVLPGADPATLRGLLAAADALLLGDTDDYTGRLGGRALLYGAIPIVPLAGAYADDLVDYDPASQTGSAFLYPPGSADDVLAAVGRALHLRATSDGWTELVRALLAAAPRWRDAVGRLDDVVAGLAESARASA